MKTLLSDPEVLRRQYEQGHGDPAVDVRAEQEGARLERKLTALDREVARLLDAYQAEVTVCFERIIFAGENRCNDQQGFRGYPA